MEKLHLEKNGKMMLVLGERDLTESEERGCRNLNKAVLVMEDCYFCQ